MFKEMEKLVPISQSVIYNSQSKDFTNVLYLANFLMHYVHLIDDYRKSEMPHNKHHHILT